MMEYIKYNFVELSVLLICVVLLFIVINMLRSKKTRYKIGFYLNYILYKIGINKSISSKYVSGIRAQECYEILHELKNHSKIIINKDTVELPVLLRKQVVKKLFMIANQLPDNHCLKIYSAFRSRIALHDIWKKELERVQSEMPNIGRAELLRRVNNIVSNPADSMGGHDTGGAVDLSICDNDGKDLDFGTKYHEKYANVDLTKEQIHNRKYLVKLMKSQDFVNNPKQWWHFSYGDKRWAAYKGKRRGAIYASAEKEFENTGYVRIIKTDVSNISVK